MPAKYKITKLPSVYRTSPEESYYGAQKSRTRREATLSEAQTQLEAGQKTFEDFTSASERILGKSIGLPERVQVGETQSYAQQREYTLYDTDAAAKYARGELSFDEYISYLDQTLGRYTEGSSQYLERGSLINQIGIDKLFSEVNALTTDFTTGRLAYESYSTQLQSYLSQFAEGSDYYNQIVADLEAAQQTWATTQYNSLVTDYQNGEITYTELIEELKEIGQEIGEGVTPPEETTIEDTRVIDSVGVEKPDIGGPQRDQVDKNYDDILIGDTPIGDIIDDLDEQINQQEYVIYADDYSKGKISFEDYAEFLKDSLTQYQEGSQQYEELSTVWEDAYYTELERYKTEIDSLKDTMKPKEYKQFLEWYKKQIKKGPQQVTEFAEFTYKKQGKEKKEKKEKKKGKKKKGKKK